MPYKMGSEFKPPPLWKEPSQATEKIEWNAKLLIENEKKWNLDTYFLRRINQQNKSVELLRLNEENTFSNNTVNNSNQDSFKGSYRNEPLSSFYIPDELYILSEDRIQEIDNSLGTNQFRSMNYEVSHELEVLSKLENQIEHPFKTRAESMTSHQTESDDIRSVDDDDYAINYYDSGIENSDEIDEEAFI